MEQKDNVFLYFHSNEDISDYLLECVKQGRSDLIRDYATEEVKKERVEYIFGTSRRLALRAFMVLWIEAAKLASSMGLSDEQIDRPLEKCVDLSYTAATPWDLAVVTERLLVEYAEEIKLTKERRDYPPIIIRFKSYVISHISQKITIEDLSEVLNISPSHLSHVVKEETGKSVHQLIMEERINTAKILLSNKSNPMNAIWVKLGFCSQSHFARTFCRVTGESPTAFRNKFQN